MSLVYAEPASYTGADLVAADRCEERTDWCRGHMHLQIVSTGNGTTRGLEIFRDVTHYQETFEGCLRTDGVQQFFLAKTASLLRAGWDNVLKNNDHYDFLLNAR